MKRKSSNCCLAHENRTVIANQCARLSNGCKVCYNGVKKRAATEVGTMAYINGLDRNQVQMITASLDDFIAQDNPVRVIDAYVNSLDLKKLGNTKML